MPVETIDRAERTRTAETKANHEIEHGGAGKPQARDKADPKAESAVPANSIFMIERGGGVASSYILRHSYKMTINGKEEKFPEIIVRFTQYDKQMRDKHGEISHKGWLMTDLRDCAASTFPNPVHRPTGTSAPKPEQVAALAAMLMETKQYQADGIQHFEEFEEIRAHDRKKADALAALDADFDAQRKAKVGKRGAAPATARA